MARRKDPCLDLANQSRFGLSPQKAKDVVDELKAERQAIADDATVADKNQKFREKSKEITATQRFQMIQRRRQRKRQVFKNEALDGRLNAVSNIKDKAKTLSRLLVGSAKQGFAALDSVASKQVAMRKLRVGRVLSVFNRAGDGLFSTENLQLSRPTVMGRFPFGRGLFDDEDFQRSLIVELFDGLGKSGNPDARKLADAILKEKRDMINKLQAEGVPIRWLDDHVTTQTHDAIAISKAGLDEWIATIEPLLNKNRTFTSSDPVKQREFLEAVYNNIKSGKRKSVELVTDSGQGGRPSLGSTMSASRQLHFENADAWIKYNQLYGHSNAVQSVIQGIERLSDSLELIKVMGADPDASFERLLNKNNFEPFQKRMLKSEMNQVTGAAFEVDGPKLHKWTQGIAAIQSLSKLGSAIFSSTTDPIYVAFTQHYHGKNIFSAYYNAFINVGVGRFLQRAKSREIELFARKLGLGFDGVIGSAAGRFAGARDNTEVLQGAVNNFFRLNGLSGWTNWYREGSAYLMASDFADATKMNWDQLAPSYRRLMERYGITDADWKDIAALPKDKVNGLDVMMPQRVYDEIELGNITGDAIPRSEELAEKIQQLLITENEFAIMQPGANEGAFMARYPVGGREGTTAGTIQGTIGRLFWQFRSFGLTMIFRQWPRAYEMGAPALMHLVPMVGIGYGAMASKDLLKMRELKKADDPVDLGKIAVASVLQSGFGGLAGDYLFNDYRQYGSSAYDVVGGASVSTFNDLFNFGLSLFDTATGKDPVDAAAAGWRAIKSNIPYSNWWASRTAFDYLVNYQIQEILNPGSLRRMERRFKQKNNQDYNKDFLGFDMTPSSVIARGGGLR